MPVYRKRPFAIHADRLQRSLWSAGCSAVATQPATRAACDAGRVAVLRPGRLARGDELCHIELREVVRLAARRHLDSWQVESEIAKWKRSLRCFYHKSHLSHVDGKSSSL